MTRFEFANKIVHFTKNELYLLTRRLLLQEFLGSTHNKWKTDLLFEECQRRNPSIFRSAFSDASCSAESIRFITENSSKAILLRRIDFMNKPELRTYLQTVGASKYHTILDDSAKIEDIFKKIDSGSDELTICKVCGDSMEKARIFDGDYILVDRNTQPKDNAIALITLADNILVKRLKIDDNRLYLFSENDKYPPYEVHETDDFNILGIVKMVLLPAENL